MDQIIKFGCLTGLRPSEVVEAVKLINDKEAFAKYYRPERQALEHFRFPDVYSSERLRRLTLKCTNN